MVAHDISVTVETIPAVDCVCGLKKACARAHKRSGALIYFAVELSKWFVGVAQEPHIRALSSVKMGLELGAATGDTSQRSSS